MDKFVLKNDDGELLLFTGTEDLEYHITIFTIRMKVEGHAIVVAVNDEFLPIRSDEAYARRDRLLGYVLYCEFLTSLIAPLL